MKYPILHARTMRYGNVIIRGAWAHKPLVVRFGYELRVRRLGEK